MKRRPGDRRDGTLIRHLDPMHFVVPMLYPNRCDNEAFISERIDLTNTMAWINWKNRKNLKYPYNLFQIVVAASMKTLTLRPKMNRFIANRSIYQRNRLTASFVVKKQYADEGKEALAVIQVQPDDTIRTIRKKMYRQITDCRGEGEDRSTKSMDIFSRYTPLPAAKAFASFVSLLDRYGKVPQAFIETDPYYTSVVLTNLGSIGLKAGYHHLTNWGTNSVFVAIGEIKKRPFYDEEGKVSMCESVDIGLTIDERIADGYYYSQTVKLLKKLIENPQLLEGRMDEDGVQ